MDKHRIKLGILILLFSPLLFILTMNILFSPDIFEMPNTLQNVALALLYLSSIFILFLAFLRIIPEKFMPYFVASFIFSYCLFISWLVFIAAYQAPNLQGALANFSIIPSIFLLCALWAISVFTTVFIAYLKFDGKILAWVFISTFVFSSGFVAAKELHFRFNLENFFCNYREGEIIFASDAKNNLIFHIADRKTSKHSNKLSDLKDIAQKKSNEENISPNGQYLIKPDPKSDKFLIIHRGTNRQIFKLSHWVVSPAEIKWSPNSRFIAYNYNYDQDDPLKIFIADIEKNKTILLAGGELLFWIK